MEFGGVMLGMEGLVGGGNSDNGSNGGGNGSFSSALISSSENTDSRRQKALSGFSAAASLKQGRTGVGGVTEEQDWRSPKMTRTETTLLPTEKGHFSLSSSFPKSTSNSHSLFPGGRHMLSFSSSKQDTLVLCSDGNLPSYNHHQTVSSTSASSSIMHTGLGRNMHGVLAGFSRCFTPTQLVELEHQAMIYKFIDANVPIPPNLLISIKKSLNPAGCIGYSTGSLTPSTYGWGSFQLGFSGSSDPEPGRCRRTDGKKWRCSRDAVADQKYCERHMNRGRHRSRKPVEGLAGHANSMSIITPSSTTDTAQTQIKNLQAGLTEPSLTQYNRMLMNKQSANNQVRDLQGLSMSISTSPSASDVPPFQKHSNPFVHSSDQMDFLPSSYMDSRNSANPPNLCNQENQPQLLHHLFGILPQNHSDNSTITWPELEALNTERAQLSISIPMTSTCFSISSSLAQEKLTLSPLKSSQELDPTIHIGLGISSALDNVNHHKQGSWAPLSWGASTGGPLGEVLNNANSNLRDRPESNSSSPNLADDWDSSPRVHYSPTGVLQKTALGSHSSSTGSSPRADNHRIQETITGNNPCDDQLESSLAISTPIPSV